MANKVTLGSAQRGALKSPCEPAYFASIFRYPDFRLSRTARILVVMTNKLVLDLKPASASRVRAIDRHELDRETDGTSAIDPTRRHLNQTLYGLKEGPSASLAAFYDGGVKRPTKQAEAPYLTAVISASAKYFRPDDPDTRGTWDEGRMTAWRDRSMAWLRAEFGDDLVHASLHLDEDTPHIHALIAPTYEKKRRVPGRRKRNETEDDFEARKLAAQDAPGVRTVGRSSHAELSQRGSYIRLRESLAAAVADIGIEYGDDRQPDAPGAMSTREWVAQETVKLRREAADLATRQDEFEKTSKAQEAQIQQREAICDQREKTLDRAEDELLEQQTQLDAKESRLRRIHQKVQELLGHVADRLGVGQTLREITETIQRGLAADDPFGEVSPPEETREEASGPGF